MEAIIAHHACQLVHVLVVSSVFEMLSQVQDLQTNPDEISIPVDVKGQALYQVQRGLTGGLTSHDLSDVTGWHGGSLPTAVRTSLELFPPISAGKAAQLDSRSRLSIDSRTLRSVSTGRIFDVTPFELSAHVAGS